MSEWKWISDRPVNLVSTYQQVVRNMLYIQENVLPVVDALNATVLSDDPEADTDARLTENSFRVNNLHVDTGSSGINDPPSAYVRNLTLELKLADAIGLAGIEGFGERVFVVTVSTPEGSPVAWQCAYGLLGPSTLYYRKASEEVADGWTEWSPAAGTAKVPKQIISSDTQPEIGSQEIGDYWMEPIGAPASPSYIMVDVDDETSIIELNDDTAHNFVFEDPETGEQQELDLRNIDFSDYEHMMLSGRLRINRTTLRNTSTTTEKTAVAEETTGSNDEATNVSVPNLVVQQ